MRSTNTLNGNPFSEVNVKLLIKKIFDRKWLFAISVLPCLALAFFYTKIAPVKYEVSTTLLIDEEGAKSVFDENKQFGRISNPVIEKNLHNEMAILKSYDLIRETMAELDFGVSYFTGPWYAPKEKMGYFPFKVLVQDTSSQAYGIDFQVKVLNDTSFTINAESDDFSVIEPATEIKQDIEDEFKFSGTYNFGDEIKHDFFHFVLNRNKDVAHDAFEEEALRFKLNNVDGLTNAYKANLKVTQTDMNASILKLQTEGPIVEKQKQFLNLLAQKYVTQKKLERSQRNTGKVNLIQQKISVEKDSLRKSRMALSNFKTVNTAINLQQSATNALEQLQQLEMDKAQLISNIDYFQSLRKNIKDSTKINQINPPSMAGINDPLLGQTVMELRELYDKKAERSFYLTDKTYDIQGLELQIANTTKLLEDNLTGLISQTEITLNSKNNQMELIESTLNRLPTDERQLSILERKYNYHLNNMNFLDQELAKATIAASEGIIDTKVLDAPRRRGSGPVAPQKKLIMAFGLFAGLLLPFAWIVFFESWDDVISDIEQIETFSNISVAASIGHLNAKSSIFGPTSSQWMVEESFRDLCANLQLMVPDSQKKVIGVTSTLPEEGKTFCARNLGINLAAEGKKVLLIDFDLRSPDLLQDIEYKTDILKDIKITVPAKTNGNTANNNGNSISKSIFELEKKETIRLKGLMDYLNDDIESIHEIYHPYNKETNLYFIPPVHVKNENPHRILSDKKLGRMLKELSEHFDYIVLDSPPVGLVSDYLMLSRHIDIHLFVVRRKKSKISFLAEIDKFTKKGRMKDVFLLFNDVAGKSFKYGYSGYYYGKNVK